MFPKGSLFFFLSALLIVGSCTKPVLIGSELLDDEKSDLAFSDSFDLTFYTEPTDSVLVHSDNVSLQLSTYLLGQIEEPIFGKYSAEIYAQPVLAIHATPLIGATLDSVVLQLRYDTLGLYGAYNEPVTVEVYRMIENPDFTREYFSNETFLTDPEPLGSLTFVPNPTDSITVNSKRHPASIRIPLSISKLNDLVLQDSIVYMNFDTFLNFFNGLHIKMTGATNTMLGFKLISSSSGMYVYFDQSKEFQFIFNPGSVTAVHMEHDYSGSLVEASLTQDPETDYWFVQGMSGVTSKMRIGGLEALGDAIINQAELEVYCTFPDGDMPEYYPPIRYLVTQEKSDSSITTSLDVLAAISRVNGILSSESYKNLYGGVLEKVSDGPPAVYKYTMKVTSQVRDIQKGDSENFIYFNPFQKANVPNRSVMYGPGHPQYAPRLLIYYTSL